MQSDKHHFLHPPIRAGFISGVHLWLVKVNNLSEPDSIFIGVCRGCMPLDADPQDLRDRTYYLSNGVIRVGGRRVATNAAQFTKGDIVGVVLDADQGEIVFLRNGMEQGRARGIRGRLHPFVSFDSEGDQVALLGKQTGGRSLGAAESLLLPASDLILQRELYYCQKLVQLATVAVIATADTSASSA